MKHIRGIGCTYDQHQIALGTHGVTSKEALAIAKLEAQMASITVNGVVFERVADGPADIVWYQNGSTILSYDEHDEMWCVRVADVAFLEECRTAEKALEAVDARARKYAGVLTELDRLGIGGGK